MTRNAGWAANSVAPEMNSSEPETAAQENAITEAPSASRASGSAGSERARPKTRSSNTSRLPISTPKLAMWIVSSAG